MITSAAFLFIFFASYCNAGNVTLISHIEPEFTDDTYVNYDIIPKLDNTEVFGPNALRDFYMVMISGFFTLQLNLFGSLYVIHRTYLLWKRGGKDSVSLSLRFPFYVALTDAFLCLSFTINLSYTLVRKLPWPNPACRFIGSSGITLLILNMLLVGCVALTTWLYVCKEYYLEFGRYDYKLWTAMLFISAAIFSVSIKSSGQQKYWCTGKHHSIVVPIVVITFMISILMTILICYIKVLLKIQSNDDYLIFTRSKRARIETRALRKLISYIFIYILQFIPLLVYNGFMIAEIQHVLLQVLAVTTINFGGIGNFVQFVINEGLSSQNLQPTTSAISEQKTQENKDSVDEQSTEVPNLTPQVCEIVVTEVETKEVSEADLNYIINEFDETLTNFDGATLVTANSSDILLKQDDDFSQNLSI